MLKSLLSQAAAQLDRAAVQAATHLLTRNRVSSLSHDERMTGLQRLRGLYERDDLITVPDTFFPRPSSVDMEMLQVGRHGESDVFELSFDVRYRTFLDDIREKYTRHPHSARGIARLYTPGGPGRPAAILVHGYLCGQWALEERLWPIAALNRWGLDAVVMVLPFHAVRGGPGLASPLFPSADPRINVEGFRQAVMEIRALTSFLRDRGAPAVGLMGMSLGGYTAALASTLDRYDFVVPMIPLSSMADFARDGGRLSEDPSERAEQHRALDAVYRVVSPFARPAMVTGDRALVVTGAADRITPSHHANRLADHLHARTHVFHGGHLLQLGRSNAFRAVGSMLDRIGLRAARDA